jgi:hypothetical protein
MLTPQTCASRSRNAFEMSFETTPVSANLMGE